ncbi:VRR-NUC domain-containing protein [Halopseudomonas sabulinigri]|uniref:phosphodiesterase I n=1 Tax=Halopseudomonas sabulinigri TaxID=472181 RepID=A0ABP9ZKC9_9GAMM
MPIPDAADFYYLSNFQTVLDWVLARYRDLLSDQELGFAQGFVAAPKKSRALLVRLIMRKGQHFRLTKLQYDEIGDIDTAATPLLVNGWLRDDAPLYAEELATLLLKNELAALLPNPAAARQQSKTTLTTALAALQPAALPYRQWPGVPDESLVSLTVSDICDRFRLLFFGNLAQSWSEFVLADLGVYRYEQVVLSAESRAFSRRQDVEDYLLLWQCRDAFNAGASVTDILAWLSGFHSDNPWIEQRHQRLLFQLAQHFERQQQLEQALALYQRCHHTGARQRCIRLLEKSEQAHAAYALAQQALLAPESEAERQLVQRAVTRLTRKLNMQKSTPATARPTPEQHLVLPQLPDRSVEQAVAEHLGQGSAPVYYVENTLICSLFGLLCWEAIFAPLPGAFFHPFHSGPADLHSADFYPRRRALFDRCLAQLDSAQYQRTINHYFQQKQGIQSPFVCWSLLNQPLLETALRCIPAAHLRYWFQRLLGDIKANRAGMPDLIQFWPAQQRYRMIEVKGPGDRLQDNQRRWLAFCAEHQMPVEVCYVQWQQPA